jgi:phosphopantothenoylcysteine decarboxylase/phosphopantothenate--cysteine ligase
MGVELAKALRNKGAQVTLVLGPNSIQDDLTGIDVKPIRSAKDLLAVVQEEWAKQDAGIFAAAVADYRPAKVADQKIKKKEDALTIELVKNPDVLKWAGENKKNQFLIGFALETNNEKENALGKLKAKNLDAIVLNSLQDKGAGFAHDTNKICIFDKNNKMTDFELKSKKSVAQDIVDYLSNRL